MNFLVRLILVFATVVQAIPGLTAGRCAGMGGTMSMMQSGADEAAGCPCCAADAQSDASECPTAGAVLSCTCGQPQRSEPAAPVSDQRVEQIQALLVVLPTLAEIVASDVAPTPMSRSFTDPSPHRPANSIQSLLCVWVM